MDSVARLDIDVPRDTGLSDEVIWQEQAESGAWRRVGGSFSPLGTEDSTVRYIAYEIEPDTLAVEGATVAGPTFQSVRTPPDAGRFRVLKQAVIDGSTVWLGVVVEVTPS